MKLNLNSICTLFILTAVTFTFTSCDDDDNALGPNVAQFIVAQWEMQSFTTTDGQQITPPWSIQGETYDRIIEIFDQNGDYSFLIVRPDNTAPQPYEGAWKWDQEGAQFSIDQDSYEVMNLNQDNFQYRDDEGNVYAFTRIQ